MSNQDQIVRAEVAIVWGVEVSQVPEEFLDLIRDSAYYQALLNGYYENVRQSEAA